MNLFDFEKWEIGIDEVFLVLIWFFSRNVLVEFIRRIIIILIYF